MRRIDIAPLTPEGGSLTGYLHDPDNAYIHRGPRPALLVIPGGGYRKLVEHEGDPVAWEFFTAGFHTFVLTYSIWRGTKKDCQEMFLTAWQYYKFFYTPDNTNLNPKLIKAKSICYIYPPEIVPFPCALF